MIKTSQQAVCASLQKINREVCVFMLLIVALLLALAATICAYIFLLPESKRDRLPGWVKVVADVLNFKYLFLDGVLRATYIFLTAFSILYGLFLLFSEGWPGLVTMLLTPILIRIIYECSMLVLILVRNVTEINKKMKGEVKAGPSLHDAVAAAKAEEKARRQADFEMPSDGRITVKRPPEAAEPKAPASSDEPEA